MTTSEFPEIDPIATEVRRTKRNRVLGEDAVCLLCGLGNVASLLPVSRSILEAHHLVGRANDETLLGVLCRNCHAEITEGYRDAGVPLTKPATLLHFVVAVFRSIGTLLLTLGERMLTWAEQLIRFIAALDVQFPSWRTMVAP
jgi:hypothetical protein